MAYRGYQRRSTLADAANTLTCGEKWLFRIRGAEGKCVSQPVAEAREKLGVEALAPPGASPMPNKGLCSSRGHRVKFWLVPDSEDFIKAIFMSQAARIQALSIGHALNADSAGLGVVHSVFARAVNLMVREEMWTLLAAEKADLPF